jgi:hypothetical protein
MINHRYKALPTVQNPKKIPQTPNIISCSTRKEQRRRGAGN